MTAGRPRAFIHQCAWHDAATTSGQYPYVTGETPHKIFHCEDRGPFGSRQMTKAERSGEPGVTLRPIGDHNEPVIIAVIIAAVIIARCHRNFGTKGHRQSRRPGRPCTAHHPVHTVAVGES